MILTNLLFVSKSLWSLENSQIQERSPNPDLFFSSVDRTDFRKAIYRVKFQRFKNETNEKKCFHRNSSFWFGKLNESRKLFFGLCFYLSSSFKYCWLKLKSREKWRKQSLNLVATAFPVATAKENSIWLEFHGENSFGRRKEFLKSARSSWKMFDRVFLFLEKFLR